MPLAIEMPRSITKDKTKSNIGREFMYISVTGLKLTSRRHFITFWRHAIPSFKQAEKAAGNLYTAVKSVDGYHHTITAWKTKKDMKAYVASGPHLVAMKKFKNIATGKIASWDGDVIPTWDEALMRWHEEAKDVG